LESIKLADYLRSNVKNDRGGATGFEQRARRPMLRRVIQCVNENVRINEARLNGHRRRCRGGEGGPTLPRCQSGNSPLLGRTSVRKPASSSSRRKAAFFTNRSAWVPALVAICERRASRSGVKCTSMRFSISENAPSGNRPKW